MNRAIIDVPSVLGDTRKANDQWDFMLDKDKKIGYIRITSFIQNTTEELKKALERAEGRGHEGPDPRPPRQPGRPAERRRSRSPTCSSRTGAIVSTKGRNTATKTYDGREGRDLHRLPDGRPGQPELGLGRRDRLGLPPGPRPRGDRRPALVRQGLGAEHPRPRGRQQRPQADRGHLLAPLGQEHPPVQERQGEGRVGRLAQPRPGSQAHARGVRELGRRPPRPRPPLDRQGQAGRSRQARGREAQGRRGRRSPSRGREPKRGRPRSPTPRPRTRRSLARTTRRRSERRRSRTSIASSTRRSRCSRRSWRRRWPRSDRRPSSCARVVPVRAIDARTPPACWRSRRPATRPGRPSWKGPGPRASACPAIRSSVVASQIDLHERFGGRRPRDRRACPRPPDPAGDRRGPPTRRGRPDRPGRDRRRHPARAGRCAGRGPDRGQDAGPGARRPAGRGRPPRRAPLRLPARLSRSRRSTPASGWSSRAGTPASTPAAGRSTSSSWAARSTTRRARRSTRSPACSAWAIPAAPRSSGRPGRGTRRRSPSRARSSTTTGSPSASRG